MGNTRQAAVLSGQDCDQWHVRRGPSSGEMIVFSKKEADCAGVKPISISLMVAALMTPALISPADAGTEEWSSLSSSVIGICVLALTERYPHRDQTAQAQMLPNSAARTWEETARGAEAHGVLTFVVPSASGAAVLQLQSGLTTEMCNITYNAAHQSAHAESTSEALATAGRSAPSYAEGSGPKL